MANVGQEHFIRVHEDKRYLTTWAGVPFFYLGDTAWELFHRLDRAQADHYLATRARQGFTVIQAVALAELDGLRTPNPYGQVPLHDMDPARPNDKYFEHVDYIVNKAAELGLTVGLLPTWGDKVNATWSPQHVQVFHPDNARAYGRFLGERYRDKPVIWILGGDRPLASAEHLLIYRAMAKGLREGDGGRHPMTFHPCGGRSSAEFVHAEPWLDFNMLQSGHSGRDIANWNTIELDRARVPAKPVLDGEPNYEDHPVMGPGWKPTGEWFDDYDCRKQAWRALLAGACGHTYGCHGVWQMWTPGRDPISQAGTPWNEAMDLPGATQMRHVRDLVEANGFWDRVPDETLLAEGPGQGPERGGACRGADETYILAYAPLGRPLTIRPHALQAGRLSAAWYDPRTGQTTQAGDYPADADIALTPPTAGPGQDWLAILRTQ